MPKVSHTISPTVISPVSYTHLPAMSKFGDRKYPLEVRHYGNKPGTYSLYDDDGSSYNYEKGEFPRIDLPVTVDKKGKKKGKAIQPNGKKIWSFSEYNFKFLTE